MTEFDQESRLIDDDHATTRLWLRMLTCTNLIESTLRSKMREEFSTTLLDLISLLNFSALLRDYQWARSHSE